MQCKRACFGRIRIVTVTRPSSEPRLPNDELQRTSDGIAAGSPLNSVFGGPDAVEWPEVNDRLFRACRLMM
jgi:hypothetical protein